MAFFGFGESRKVKAVLESGRGARRSTPGELCEGTYKATVIARLQRIGGATLQEIVDATGYQSHTVRGFISILCSKGGMKIGSTRRESDGARVYEA